MSINIFTGKPRPLPLPNLTSETDCEDQGFSLISDGCPSHKIAFTKRQSPSNASLKGGGPWYWYCAECPGYFGEVAQSDIGERSK